MEDDEFLSDPVFDDIGMQDVAEKRKFLEFCRKGFEIFTDCKKERSSVAGPVLFRDWMVYISLVLLSGCVDHRGSYDLFCYLFHFAGNISVEKGGRICKLCLGMCQEGVLYDLPASIGRLEQLKRLDLINVKALPLKELSSLPQLQVLEIEGCSDSLSDSFCVPKSVRFPHLKELFLSGSPSFQMLHRCEALESLRFHLNHQIEIDHILAILSSPDIYFAEKLQRLEIMDCGACQLECHQLETILFRVLPRFPNLHTLHILLKFELPQLKGIADRIRNDQSCIISKSLQRIRFWEGEDFLCDKDGDPDTVAAVRTLLKTFRALENICFYNLETWNSILIYEMVVNAAGRRILEGNGSGSGNACGLPLSVWPLLLQRAQSKIENRAFGPRGREKATGLYYLLREGPVLLERGVPIGGPEERPVPTTPNRLCREQRQRGIPRMSPGTEDHCV